MVDMVDIPEQLYYFVRNYESRITMGNGITHGLGFLFLPHP